MRSEGDACGHWVGGGNGGAVKQGVEDPGRSEDGDGPRDGAGVGVEEGLEKGKMVEDGKGWGGGQGWSQKMDPRR